MNSPSAFSCKLSAELYTIGRTITATALLRVRNEADRILDMQHACAAISLAMDLLEAEPDRELEPAALARAVWDLNHAKTWPDRDSATRLVSGAFLIEETVAAFEEMDAKPHGTSSAAKQLRVRAFLRELRNYVKSKL